MPPTVIRKKLRPPRIVSPDHSMERLERIVRERVDSGRTTGIVAGMVFADGQTRVVVYGDGGRGSSLDEASVFEIGSITKVLTATLLAEMAQRGELGLSDPVAGLLPAGASVPSRGGRQITLEDLATHTSGLPSHPAGFEPSDPRTPFADFTVDMLYAFLERCTLSRAPGSRYEYSNLGVGLLGHALALRAQTSYEELVRERILEPLRMTSTAVAASDDMARLLATGHDARGRLAPYFEIPALAGAGALRSSITDMLGFAAANLGGHGGPLAPAVVATHAPRRKIGLMMRIGLGWHILGSGARRILSHAGGTAGFSSSIALMPARGTAIVVLSNSRQAPVEDIALHLLEKRLPLARPPQQRTEITLAPELLERYVGVYDVAGTRATVTRSSEGLSVHASGETDRLYAETKTRFFFKAMDAQVTFKLDARRRVTGAVLHQDGQRIPVRKVG
jgi:D-alanyl-D-alanine-carboxypeptidase/D-alanyl-D-alanine-endopeptidase